VEFEKIMTVVCAKMVLDATPLGIGTADTEVADTMLGATAVLEDDAVLEAIDVLAIGLVLAASGVGRSGPWVVEVTVSLATMLCVVLWTDPPPAEHLRPK